MLFDADEVMAEAKLAQRAGVPHLDGVSGSQ